MLSFGIARRAVALPCLSTRTRSDRHFPDLAGACARGGGGVAINAKGIHQVKRTTTCQHCEHYTPKTLTNRQQKSGQIGNIARTFWLMKVFHLILTEASGCMSDYWWLRGFPDFPRPQKGDCN